MISTRLHGVWVRNIRSGEVGRIAYYDTKTKRVWVVWEGQEGAGGYRPQDLKRVRFPRRGWWRDR